MSSNIFKSMLLLAVCAAGTPVLAQQTTQIDGRVNTITTAVPFLRISPDARAGGMGDVGIATEADANAQYWNVGKMPFAPKQYGISVTYTPWLKELVPDIALYYVSGYAKFGRENNQAISGSLRYFNLGDINYTNDIGTPLGTGKPREFSLDLGYSRRFTPYLSTGISLRYIRSAIANGLASGTNGTDYQPGNAIAADVGVYYTRTKEIDGPRTRTFSAGVVLSNLGSKISYSSTRNDFIPANLGIGVANTWQIDEYNKFTAALDVNKLLVPTPQYSYDSNGNVTSYIPSEKGTVAGIFSSFGDAPGGFSEELREFQVSLGAEYWYQNQFGLRAGYFYEDKTKGDRKYFTVGGSARYNIFTLNFSYLIPSNSGITRNPLSNTLRFSLLFEFDKIRGNRDESASAE
jgi:hypothetical protein